MFKIYILKLFWVKNVIWTWPQFSSARYHDSFGEYYLKAEDLLWARTRAIKVINQRQVNRDCFKVILVSHTS